MTNVTREKTEKRQLMKVSCFFVLALLLIAISPGTALAGDVVVDGEEISFGSDDVIHNLKVINGGSAHLNGTTVQGNITIEGEGSYCGFSNVLVGNDVTVRSGARLSMWYSTIGNNLKGDRSGHINFLISNVLNNIDITGGADFNAEYGPCVVGNDLKYKKGSCARFKGFTIGGNMEVSENASPSQYFGIEIKNCEIGNDLKVLKNTMTAFIKVIDNKVGNNMRIKDNTPAPEISGNDVEGNVELD